MIKNITKLIPHLLAFCLISVITSSSIKANTQSAIGIAAMTVNLVTGTVETETNVVNVNDQIFRQEIIETNSVSSTQILFMDETVLSIGPDSRLIMDEMVYDPDSNTGKVVVTAARGLFTFVTGSLASESYEINTPTATIGVRGTKFDLFVSRKGASTVILRSGAVDMKNIRSGATRRIATVGLATSIVTPKSEPTPPAAPSLELAEVLKPLANPILLQGLTPETVDFAREDVEEKSNKKREKALKRQEKREKAAEKRKKQKDKKAENRKKKKEKKAAKRKKKKEKKAAKRKKKKEKKAAKRKKRTEKKKKRLAKRKANKASKSAKRSAKKSSKSAKRAAKKASKSAKRAAKKASQAAKKAAKKAKNTAKKAAKKAKNAAKKAAKKAKTAAKKAAKTAKKAAKKAAKTAKKAAKKASKAAKKAAKKASKMAKKAGRAARRAAKRAAKRAAAAAKKTN